jgi:hypothetical protein
MQHALESTPKGEAARDANSTNGIEPVTKRQCRGGKCWRWGALTMVLTMY